MSATKVKQNSEQETGDTARTRPASNGMETVIYNQKGEAAGKISLPESVFGVKWNSDLVHQVVSTMRTNMRKPIAHTKDRGEVRGGGKKPWQQKGTGRSRHGSIRSPIWVGGGVAHGPTKDKNFERKINRKMKAKAVYTILSRKLKDNEMIFVDDFSFAAPKAKEAKQIFASLGKVKNFKGLATKKRNAVYVALGSKDANTEKSFRNFGNVLVSELRNISPVDLVNYKYILITKPENSVQFLAKKMNVK